MKSSEEFRQEFHELQQDYDSLKEAFDNYIAEHNRNEKALRESEGKYRMLIENLNEIIYTLDQKATITYISPNIETISGYTSDEVIGKCFVDFVHPDDIDGRMEQFHKILSGINETSEYRMLTKEGRSVWVRTAAKPFVKEGGGIGIQGVLTEITDLKESEERLNTLISQTPAIIYSYKIIDGKLHLTYVNENVINILGFAPEELIGNTELWYSLLHPDESGIAENTLKSNMQGKDSYSEYRFMDKNGMYHWLHDKQKVTKNEDGEIEVIGATWDITGRKSMEEELIEAKNKAEESNRLKSIFLTNLSHEIRTPMNGILGFAELLNNPDLTRKSRKNYLSIITESGERMLDTINNLMDISKIEAGEIKVTNSETNINDQIIYTYDFFKPEAEIKGIHFSYTTNMPDNESVIKTDREKLNAILVNLVKNAIKYTDEGSIEFGYFIKDDELLFFVKDTGIGISREQQEIVFERFRQVDASHSRKYDGIGLGLSITKAYVEMLGGKIWIEPGQKKGTIFYFTLPLSKSIITAKPKDHFQDKSKMSGEYDFSGITILIAEDEKSVQIYFEEILKSTNAKIIMAENGQEAIDLIEKNPDIDIALIDIKMPVMDGLEAARNIKKKFKSLPLIAQTAYSQKHEREKAFEAGFDEFISKPIDRYELLKLIKSL